MSRNLDLVGLRCHVIDAEEARTTTHRETLLILAQTFDEEGAYLLCEPSIVRGRSGPPDIAILDPRSGLHVVEIKGVPLESVRAVRAGGAIEIAYGSNLSRKDPVRQATNKMFEIKDAAARYFGGDLNISFHAWAVFPRITRSAWVDKFGGAVSARPEVLFSDDLESSHLGEKLRKRGVSRLASFGMRSCPDQQMRSVLAAFGDSEVLQPAARPGSQAPRGSKGERLDKALADYRVLTELQKRLTAQQWNDGPRLVRGVAGSGKTVVLATQAARLIEQIHQKTIDLFEDGSPPPPVLAVCFNRTLVPFLRERIELAYHQRTNETLPKRSVFVTHFNSLLYRLHQRGFCGYRRIGDAPVSGDRATQCLAEMNALIGERAAQLSKGLFAAVFVDEGQDFHESEYRLLIRLCARSKAGSPRLFVFYDDAQNLYGLQRPTWADLGLDLRGRSVVMDECFRNSRQIIEPAFNLLLGTYAAKPASVKTSTFADLATLADKNLISRANGHVRVHFAAREGDPVSLNKFDDRAEEAKRLASRCEELLKHDGLLPQDILVLTYTRERAAELSEAIAERMGADCVRRPFEEGQKDALAIQAGRVTVSTVASAKGYDAPQVLLASLDGFPNTVEGRVSAYVGCTRAREWLEVSAANMTDLVGEFERSLTAFKGSAAHI